MESSNPTFAAHTKQPAARNTQRLCLTPVAPASAVLETHPSYFSLIPDTLGIKRFLALLPHKSYYETVEGVRQGVEWALRCVCVGRA